jgi:hypothetical protein
MQGYRDTLFHMPRAPIEASPGYHLYSFAIISFHNASFYYTFFMRSRQRSHFRTSASTLSPIAPFSKRKPVVVRTNAQPDGFSEVAAPLGAAQLGRPEGDCAGRHFWTA